MSYLVLGKSVGLMLGCAIGGLLAEQSWIEIFEIYPFFLPMLVITILLILNFSGICSFFRETLAEPSTEEDETHGSFRELIKDKNILLLLTSYFLFAFITNAVLEIIPLWCWAHVPNGGLEYSVREIGMMMTASVLLNATL